MTPRDQIQVQLSAHNKAALNQVTYSLVITLVLVVIAYFYAGDLPGAVIAGWFFLVLALAALMLSYWSVRGIKQKAAVFCPLCSSSIAHVCRERGLGRLEMPAGVAACPVCGASFETERPGER